MPDFDLTARDARDLWEGMYSSGHGHVWSGRPNAALVDAVADLVPGTALDLGCGEGGDVLHLARLGWRVTGVDVSDTAIARAAAHAAQAGLAERTRFERLDLGPEFPEGTFDLVCAQYLHSPEEVPGRRDGVLRRAAAAVAPGGLLLVVGHAAHTPWSARHHDVHLPTTGEVLAALALDPAAWHVELEDVVDREYTDPDGNPATRRDNVLRVRRGLAGARP